MTTATYMIGIVQMPSLAAALTASGYTVVTDDDYRNSARKVRAEIEANGSFPVFVADRRWPGLKAWANKIAESTDVHVLRVANGHDIAFSNVADIALPSTLGQVMAAAGRGVHPSFADLAVDANGEVSGYETGQFDDATPEPTFDLPTPVEGVPSAPDALAPIDDSTQLEENPWDDTPVVEPTAAAPASPVASTPSVEENPWDDTPVAAPAVSTPSVEENPWDDTPVVAPAVETPVFSLPEEPAAPVVAPAVETPVFSLPEEPAAPVAAPAVETPVFSLPEEPAAPVVAPAVETPVFSLPEEPAAPVVAPAVETPVFSLPEELAAPVVAPAVETPVFSLPEEPAAPTAPPAPPVAPPVEEPVFSLPEEPVAPPAAPMYEQRSGQYVEQSPDVPVSLAPRAADVFDQAPTAPGSPKWSSAPSAPTEGRAPHHRAMLAGTGGQVAFVWAAKGGVGKTSTATSVAQAAALAGLRVVLIDGNYGQGDLRLYLRLGMVALPSINNFANTRKLSSCLIDPQTLNDARDLRAETLRFGLVMTPPETMINRSEVDYNVYIDLVEEARKHADLVVVDTQIIEAPNRGEVAVGEADRYNEDMVEKFIIPMMAAGAYGVGVTDMSNAGVSNQLTRLKYMAARGIPRERQIFFINRVPEDLVFRRDSLDAGANEHSTFLGVCHSDTSVQEHQNTGGVPGSVGELSSMINRILLVLRPDLQPADMRAAADTAKAEDVSGKGRRRLFGRR